MVIITITLHDGDSPRQRIRVDESESLQILEDYIPARGRRLISHHGSILMAGFSFMYHGVKDDDHLYVIRPIDRPERRQTVSLGESSRDLTFRSDRRFFPIFQRQCPIIMEAARLSDLAGIVMASHRARQDGIDSTEHAVVPRDLIKKPMVVCPVPSSDGPNSDALPFYGVWGR
jgi:hypothetical protein